MAAKLAQLAYQIVKYQQRNGWSHRDVLRLTHPKTKNETLNAIFHYAVHGWDSVGEQPHDNEALVQIWAFERAKRATSAAEIAKLIIDYRLPRECVPTQFLDSLEVWDALLQQMPMTALIRNLATLTRIGLLQPLGAATKKAVAAITNAEAIRKARVHPVAVLIALRTYASGRGVKSDKTWEPVAQIVDALDEAFYAGFNFLEPTGKNHLLGIDVSGSMGDACAGSPMTCCEGATAMAMAIMRTEKNSFACGFNCGMQKLPITSKTRLDDALRHTRNINGGGTDCSLPMVWATQNNIEVDQFVVITDNETYAGRYHPAQELVKYRQKTGRPAKLCVIGMTATNFTIADPSDAGMLDVAGFSTDVPVVLAEFAKA